MFLNNKIHEYEEELYDFISVTSKAKLEFVKDKFMDVNLMEKLVDKITDDVVDRILSRIAENKKEKEEKNSF